MNKVTELLKACGTFYIATIDGDQPRVRPFGAVEEMNGRTYLCTNNTKACFKQMMANPKVEISGMIGDKWIRITGKVAVDPSLEAKVKFLEAHPMAIYKPDDGIFEVIYFTEAKGSIESFSTIPEYFEL